MLTVNYKITLGAATYSPGDHARLIELQADAALNVPVNVCRLTLAPPEGLSIAPEDSVAVELGYNDDLALIFTGVVGAVEWGIERVTVQAAGAFQAFVAARLNLGFEKSTAGDMVSAISNKLRVATGRVDSGLEFSVYALGETQTAYAHLRHLAQQCGFDLYANPEDKLVFAPYQPRQTHTFQYGVNILAWTVEAPTVRLTGVEVYGESPASQGQGAEASSWLTKKDVKGVAGDTSGLVARYIDPTARTQDNAAQMADALLTAKTPKKRGALNVIGAPAVKLGDAVNVANMPTADQNGVFKVLGVTHRLHARKGFITTLRLEES